MSESEMTEKESLECGTIRISALKIQKLPWPFRAVNNSLSLCNSVSAAFGPIRWVTFWQNPGSVPGFNQFVCDLWIIHKFTPPANDAQIDEPPACSLTLPDIFLKPFGWRLTSQHVGAPSSIVDAHSFTQLSKITLSSTLFNMKIKHEGS